MPLTPFMGLSIIVHVTIIFGHMVLNLFFPSRTFFVSQTKRPIVSYCMSVFVIILVVGVIFVNGALLVKGSIENQHSTVNIANEYYIYAMESRPLGKATVLRTDGSQVQPRPQNGQNLSQLNVGYPLEALAISPEVWLGSDTSVGGKKH